MHLISSVLDAPSGEDVFFLDVEMFDAKMFKMFKMCRCEIPKMCRCTLHLGKVVVVHLGKSET